MINRLCGISLFGWTLTSKKLWVQLSVKFPSCKNMVSGGLVWLPGSAAWLVVVVVVGRPEFCRVKPTYLLTVSFLQPTTTYKYKSVEIHQCPSDSIYIYSKRRSPNKSVGFHLYIRQIPSKSVGIHIRVNPSESI